MNCERCGERPARVRYTECRDDETRKLAICRECAVELGFDVPDEEGIDPDGPAPGQPWGEPPEPDEEPAAIVDIEAAVEIAVPPSGEQDALRCPGCGLTGAQLRARPLLGCPQCYETFAAPLDALFLKAHGALSHCGRLPGGRTAEVTDTRGLRRQLRDAIEREDFQEAARLRDRLRRAGADPE